VSKSGKRYSEEFRRDAVKLLATSGQSLSAVARNLGMSSKQLRAWRDSDAPISVVREETTEQEVRRLQREVDVLRQEREILKKALAIFSDRPR